MVLVRYDFGKPLIYLELHLAHLSSVDTHSFPTNHGRLHEIRHTPTVGLNIYVHMQGMYTKTLCVYLVFKNDI